MKLRYYLRGLAVGIMITTVILSIVHADKHPLTDAEIRMRALELGMVDEGSIRLTNQSGGMSATGEGDEGDADPDKAAGPKTGGASEPETEPESESGASEPETEPESGAEAGDGSDNPAAEEEPSKDGSTPEESASVPETSAEPAEAETEAVTIVIRGGDNSYTVSRNLAAAGLVEDAAAYDAFLCNNGYSKAIRTGTYEILPGTSGEDIAKMIAR